MSHTIIEERTFYAGFKKGKLDIECGIDLPVQCFYRFKKEAKNYYEDVRKVTVIYEK